MRYSIKSLLLVTFFVSLACCVLFALPELVRTIILCMVMFLAPAAMIAWIVYGDGYGRAFAIGCTTSMGLLFSAFMVPEIAGHGVLESFTYGMGGEGEAFKIVFVVVCTLIMLSGGTSMVVRRILIRNVPAIPTTMSPQDDVPVQHASYRDHGD